jgi:DHA1 family tetracycline resistance protein-like MFS transporter
MCPMAPRTVRPMAVIFVTVLVDMLSFGLVLPDLQLRAKSFGASGLTLGLVLAVFSLTQFIASPFAGRLSDRIGRKPVLAVGAALNGLAFLVYAFAHGVPSILVARILAGLGSSNIAAAYAYVADLSAPEERARSIGKIGAAFGIGFVLGPPIGGALAHAGEKWFGSGNLLLGLVALGLAAANTAWIILFLKEPAHVQAASESRGFALSRFGRAVALPGMAVLLLLFFAYNFGFSNLESTFILFANQKFGLDQLGSGLILGYVGITLGIAQGVFIGPLIARFGERNVARIGLTLVAPSLAIMPFLPSVAWVVLGSTFLSFGAGIATPSIQSLISRTASAGMQGGIFGITQGLGALARIFGPISGQTALQRDLRLPYLIAGGVVLLPVLLAWFVIAPPPAAEVAVEDHGV